MIGRTISHYRVIEKIGEGGMGEVFLAEDLSLGRRIALKFLPPEAQRDEVAHKRFLREARSAASLDHPYICTIHEVGEAEAQDFIVMEHVEGSTLAERLSGGALPLRKAVRVAAEIAEALEHAHDRRIVHRDLKPSNIMLAQAGHTKVMDFGLAKQVLETGRSESKGETLTALTMEGSTVGTLAYMSPEQLRGLEVDARSDVFSFGILFYEMLTGVHPFREASPMDTAASILNKQPAPLSQRLSEAPALLLRIIDRMLSKDREARYPRTSELREDLARLEKELDQAPGWAEPAPAGSIWKGLGKPAIVIPVLIAIIALAYLSVSTIYRERKARWAREVALPEIEQFIAKDNYSAALRLAKEVKEYLPQDPQCQELFSSASAVLSAQTTPPGAEVYIRDYGDPAAEWQFLGRSPLDKVTISRGYKRWRVSLAGYHTAEGTLMSLPPPLTENIKVGLDRQGTTPPEMVRIQGDRYQPNLSALYHPLPALQLGDYLLDRYEVSNREFKKFVDAGGYGRREYWKQPIIKDGKVLDGQAAMGLFVDKTGRPGPSTWELGEYHEGQDEFPVAGVSWYEAAAYAEFAGKSLPTIYHWNFAIGDHAILSLRDAGYILPLSNFGRGGAAPAGRFQGMSPYGVFDMAGNVKEWCWNTTPQGERLILGGAWNDEQYMFSHADKSPPLFREAGFGFRCMKAITEAQKPQGAEQIVEVGYAGPTADQKPCADAVFQVYLKLYDYRRSELRPRVESTEEVNRHTRLERVAFDAAYGDERVIAYLFMPRSGKPPFQTVVHYPGRGAWWANHFFEIWPKDRSDYHTKTGRAFVYPVLQDALERRLAPEKRSRITPLESEIMRVKDIRRTIDYLQTRPEFDVGKLAYEGLSLGGNWGAVVPAIETRFKAAVLFGAGLRPNYPPECNQINFAPRIGIPVLIQNGKYDFISPAKQAQQLLGMFGTPDMDKQLMTYEGSHVVWFRNDVIRDELAFLDKYLGPAK